MKAGYVTVVALAAMVVMVFGDDKPILPVPDRCPLVDSLNYTVHLKHESDCTKFYKCFMGRPIEMSCPDMNKYGEKLHFNPVLQVCDWPNRAGCIGTPTPVVGPGSTTPSPDRPKTNCVNAPDDTLIAHETRCYLFYRCRNHQEHLEECANGLHFNPKRQTCDKPSQSNCQIDNICRDYRSNEIAFLPDPLSCQHVYYCKGPETNRYSCDFGAEWSREQTKCLPKAEANCPKVVA